MCIPAFAPAQPFYALRRFSDSPSGPSRTPSIADPLHSTSIGLSVLDKDREGLNAIHVKYVGLRTASAAISRWLAEHTTDIVSSALSGSEIEAAVRSEIPEASVAEIKAALDYWVAGGQGLAHARQIFRGQWAIAPQLAGLQMASAAISRW